MVARDHRVNLVTPTGALRAWFAVILTVVCVGGAMAYTITYTVHRTRDICDLIVLLDDRNQKLPPVADKDTMDFRRELHRYREKLGC